VVPEGALGLIAFLLFVAPGALFEVVVAMRRPARSYTTFQEINHVVLVSVAAGALAVATAFAPRLLHGAWLQPLVTALQRGGDAWRADLLGVAMSAGLVLALAMVWAVAAALVWTSLSPSGEMYREPQWFLVFRRKCPKGARPYVIAVSSSGERHYGWLVAYSQDEESTNRDLTLGAEDDSPLFRQAPGETRRKPLRGIQRLVLSGEHVAQVYVSYFQDPPGAARSSSAGRAQ
jgi:hypothetical protein